MKIIKIAVIAAITVLVCTNFFADSQPGSTVAASESIKTWTINPEGMSMTLKFAEPNVFYVENQYLVNVSIILSVILDGKEIPIVQAKLGKTGNKFKFGQYGADKKNFYLDTSSFPDGKLQDKMEFKLSIEETLTSVSLRKVEADIRAKTGNKKAIDVAPDLPKIVTFKLK